MIQRRQTLWLLLAANVAFATLRFPFYGGKRINALPNSPNEYFTAQSNVLLLILTAGVGLLALISIFLYKNRKLQLRLTIVSLLVSLLNLVLLFLETRKFIPDQSSYNVTALLAVGVPIFMFLAVQGIRKDEKLVKSLDRLR
jgi:hypothetical protein